MRRGDCGTHSTSGILAGVSRIAVVTSHPLFASGGHLVIARALVKALSEFGHESTLLLTPQNRFGRQGAAYLSTWLTDVSQAHDGGKIDQVISLRFPSYAVRHDRHVCWINHRMREYYDQWPSFSQSLSWPARIKEGMRRGLIHAVDRHLLTDCVTRLYAQSTTIQTRLAKWGRISADVIYPPPPSRPYRCDRYGDYLLVLSRLTALKRISLVLDALRQPKLDSVRCVIVGDGEERETIASLIHEYNLSGRVILVGQVSESDLVSYLAGCRAVCFPAAQEDYGLVTVEAFASSKAVITCSDSGGPAELVIDGTNGFVVPPGAETLAAAIAEFMEDEALAEQFGSAANRQVQLMTWEKVIGQLLLV